MSKSHRAASVRRRPLLISIAILVAVALGAGLLSLVGSAPPDIEGASETAAVEAEANAEQETVTVFFESRSADGVNAVLEPRGASMQVVPGKVARVYFFMSNRSSTPVSLRSDYSVGPSSASLYYNQLDGICTTSASLAGWKTGFVYNDFFLDPAILEGRSDDEAMAITVTFTLQNSSVPPTLLDD